MKMNKFPSKHTRVQSNGAWEELNPILKSEIRNPILPGVLLLLQAILCISRFVQIEAEVHIVSSERNKLQKILNVELTGISHPFGLEQKTPPTKERDGGVLPDNTFLCNEISSVALPI